MILSIALMMAYRHAHQMLHAQLESAPMKRIPSDFVPYCLLPSAVLKSRSPRHI